MKCNSGASPRCAGSIPVTLKLRSGIRFQVRKKAVDFVPDFLSAGQTAPMHADRSDQLVTLIDRRDEIISCLPRTVDQYRFNVRLQFLQGRILAYQCFPRIEWKERFGGARGTWIIRHHFFSRRTVKEEGEVDRQREILPIGISHCKVGQCTGVARDQFESTFNHVLESQRTRVACANDLLRPHLEKMSMLRWNTNAAELALLNGRAAERLPLRLSPSELAQIGQG